MHSNTVYGNNRNNSEGNKSTKRDHHVAPNLTNSLHCVLVGDACVGKTSLIVAYTTNGFFDHYSPTAFDNYSVTVNVDEKPLKLELCDTAGRSEFDSIRPLSYTDADVFLVCFSVVQPNSLKAVTERWLPEIHAASSTASVILVGTQSDLRIGIDSSKQFSSRQANQRKPKSDFICNGEQVDLQAINWIKKQYKLEYVECSAVTHQNLKEVFDLAILYGLKGHGMPSRPKANAKGNHNSLRSLVSNKINNNKSLYSESSTSPSTLLSLRRSDNSYNGKNNLKWTSSKTKKPSTLAEKTSNLNGRHAAADLSTEPVSESIQINNSLNKIVKNSDFTPVSNNVNRPQNNNSNLNNQAIKGIFASKIQTTSNDNSKANLHSTYSKKQIIFDNGKPVAQSVTPSNNIKNLNYAKNSSSQSKVAAQQYLPTSCGKTTTITGSNNSSTNNNPSITIKEGFRKFVSMTRRFL